MNPNARRALELLIMLIAALIPVAIAIALVAYLQ